MTIVGALLVIAGIVALGGVWWYLEFRVAGGRRFTPLWMAFSFTAAALLFLTTGAMGILLDKRDRFAYTGEIVWSQVAIGLVSAAVAALMWTWALRRIARGRPDVR